MTLFLCAVSSLNISDKLFCKNPTNVLTARVFLNLDGYPLDETDPNDCPD
jgi:hypothetical protein